MDNADFLVSYHGTVVILYAKSAEAKAWVDAHLPDDRISWGLDGTAIEPRYFSDIAEGLVADGLTIGALQ